MVFLLISATVKVAIILLLSSNSIHYATLPYIKRIKVRTL